MASHQPDAARDLKPGTWSRTDTKRSHYRQSIGQDNRKGGCRGYDAGKRVKGRKRHLIVDTEGLVLKAFVTEANYQDGTVAHWLIDVLVQLYPRLKKIWADAAYRGQFVDRAAQHGIDVEIVLRSDDQQGFVVLPRRWVVERTFAWLGNYRRLSKDYEYWIYSSDAMIYAAMIHLMTRRLARLRASP